MVRAASARQRELGQNFLVDRNILDVIERLAGARRATTSCSRSAAARGSSPSGWRRRRRHVHVVELDRRLARSAAAGAWQAHDNVTLHFADALALDLAALAPAPTKVVANLPYGGGRDRRPAHDRRAAERRVVGRDGPARGRRALRRRARHVAPTAIPSVLAQLACEVKVLRPISPPVFRPVPNVDSVLLGLRRIGPGADPWLAAARARRLRPPPQGAGRLAGARSGRCRPDVRERARAALAQLGHPADERAERLAPEEFRELAARLRDDAARAAPAKINLCLFLGPTRADGRHELVTVFESVSLFDDLEIAEAAVDEVICAGVAGRNLVADAIAGLRAAGWSAPPVRVVIDKRIPVAAGMGGGSADAAAMLRCASRLAPVDAAAIAEIAAGLGADVPGQLRPGPSLGTGAGEVIAPVAELAPYGVLVLPQPFGLATRDVYAEADRLGLARPPGRLAVLAATLSGGPPDRLVNDLEPAALSLAPQLAAVLDRARGAGADDALVCGSGPTVIGVFRGPDGGPRSRRAVAELGEGIAAVPVGAGGGAPAPKQ